MKHSIRDFNFKEKKKYVVGVSVQFEAQFIGYETENGTIYAVFHEDGATDHGQIPKRRVKIDNIVEYGPIKY